MRGSENTRLTVGIAGTIRSKIIDMLLDMEGFWLRDNYRIMAVSRPCSGNKVLSPATAMEDKSPPR